MSPPLNRYTILRSSCASIPATLAPCCNPAQEHLLAGGGLQRTKALYCLKGGGARVKFNGVVVARVDGFLAHKKEPPPI